MHNCRQQIILGSVLALLSPKMAWSGECVTASCADLGYTQTAIANCKQTVGCPFDASYKACLVYETNDTCTSGRFYGLEACPTNATCTTCTINGKKYVKTITCNPGAVFTEDWTCVQDTCPSGYAKQASECGRSGYSGWTLGSSSVSSAAGNHCYACVAKSCSTSAYPYTTCLNYCDSCQPGDGAMRYGCNSQQTYYNSHCLYTLVSNGTWTSSFPSACCNYVGSGLNIPCYQMSGKSVYSYPTSNVKLTCGSIIKKDNLTYYYNYNN